MDTPPPISRDKLITQLHSSSHWDVIIIGGGATGLGTAVEAATRGYKTVLLERYDFAKGTSSRSTKLVHGGVRYLAQGNIGLVREALHERGLLLQNAPHLVRNLGFVVPGYGRWSQLFYGTGLKLYDLLAGRLGFGSSRFLNEHETLERIPTLNPNGLRGGVIYQDGQFDDARLAITLLRTFLDYGGVALNYAPVIRLLKENGHIVGVTTHDTETGKSFDLQGTVVVNATGIFVDDVRRLDEPTATAMLSPSQGIHLVIDQRFQPGHSALMIPKTEDGRILFAVPWHGKVVLGTTDTPVEKPSYEPKPLEEEVEFILHTAAQYLSPAPTRQDVLSVFAGQRPLVKVNDTKSTAALSREHVICQSKAGLLTVTGGKWTTYRKMGQDVIDQAIDLGLLADRPSMTQHLPLHGWRQTPEAEPWAVYGSDAAQIRLLPGANQFLHTKLPYVEAEVRWAARYELARTVEDILARRTRSLILDAIASIEAAPRVAEILADELGYDLSWQQQQIETYRSLAAGYVLGNGY
jgi:glycerol-3-phosphate dehydrogenase